MRNALVRLFLLLLIVPAAAFAQDPTKWSLQIERKAKAGTSSSRELEAMPAILRVVLKVEIDNGWRLYALDQPAGGPIKTTITVPEGIAYRIFEQIDSPEPKTKADQNFIVDGKPLQT